MRSIFSAGLVTVLGHAVRLALAEFTGSYPGQPTNAPGAGLGVGQIQDMGCYGSAPNFIEAGFYIYQSDGWCEDWCARNHYKVAANSNGSDCWCGTSLPSDTEKIDSTKCNTPCNGYGDKDCGGPNAFHMYQYVYSGMANAKPIPFENQNSNPPDGASASSVTNGPSTIFITASGSVVAQTIYATDGASGGSGSNKGAIAAGVVVGIIALLAIVGGIIFFMRQKKRRALEEERRRHEVISNFVGKGEKSSSSNVSITDSRLEPSVMFQRRMSDGSIADNQDYSRRILKVTNPDFRLSERPQ